MAGKTPFSIEAKGMKETVKAMKAIDADLPKEVRKANKRTAEFVAEGARSSASGTRMGHVAVGSIKARATQTSASIEGGKGVEWFSGWNFGSGRYRQFPPVTKPDYHLYATIEREGAAIAEFYADEWDRLVSANGFS